MGDSSRLDVFLSNDLIAHSRSQTNQEERNHQTPDSQKKDMW